jgi:hypothetical protein
MEITITWTDEDVWCVAEEFGIELNEAQVNDILSLLEKNHDATIGINWEVIHLTIQYYIS